MLFVVLFPMIYAAPFALWVWSPVQAGDLWLFVAIAILGSVLGITLIGQAFHWRQRGGRAFRLHGADLGQAAGVADRGDLLAFWTIVGALIIVMSGIIIVLREAASSR